jgi:predicted tellurium resistance membrane protein TerC
MSAAHALPAAAAAGGHVRIVFLAAGINMVGAVLISWLAGWMLAPVALVDVGALVLGFVAGDVIWQDSAVHQWLGPPMDWLLSLALGVGMIVVRRWPRTARSVDVPPPG